MDGKSDRLGFFAAIGAMVSGLLASICCIGPLVFVVLGLGGAALFSKLEQYRLPFALASFSLLALGFFFAYRNGGECSQGSDCAVNPRRRRFTRIVLWVAAILVAVFIFLPDIVGLFVS
ncbi:MAG: hypothetical protein KatS3mg078_0790 [Deltaproteobacteria bacterium]|nr:MAG: hypothetical protein KatS3mg078_0790 [Deltaproteobacteria bacterium]